MHQSHSSTHASRRPGAGASWRAALALACLGALAACSSPEQRVAKYTESGQAFLQEEDYGKANIQFQNALKIDEEHVPALMGLAAVAEERQNFQRMFGALQAVVRLDKDNVDAIVKLGKLYLVGSDEPQALDYAERALALEPENPDALALKAAVLVKLEDYLQAVALAEEALALEPGNAEAATVLATERSRADDYEGAIGFLDGALEANPKQSVLHLMRLQMLKKLERDDEVDEGYRRLIEEFPENPGFRRVYVAGLVEDGRLEEAREQLVAVADILAGEVDPVLDVVRVDFRLGGEEKAASTFKAYVDARPENLDLAFAYAAYLRQNGETAAAEALYRRLAEQEDDQSVELRSKNEIAGARLVEGKVDEAEKILRGVLAKDERNSDALMKLAGIKIDRGDLDEAIRDLRIVLDDDPQNAGARMLMATAFERQGDVALASREMSQAVIESQYDPKQANVFAKFLIRNNDQSRAEEILVQSLAEHPADLENLKFLAAIRLLQQDWRGAEEVAKIIDNIDDEDPVVNRILGAAYAGLEDYSGVVSALEQENARAPLEARPLATLVGAHMRTGAPEKAEALLRENIANNPENYAARMLLARVFLQQDRRDDARAVLEQAIETDPTAFAGYELLYRVHLQEERKDEARALVERGLVAAPESDGLKVIKADILLADGNDEEAMALYGDILSRRPNDRLVANNYASLLTRLRDDPESLKKAVSVAEILEDVENPYFQDTYGWALVRAGQVEAGLERLETAAAALPELAEVQYHLGAALLKKGEAARGAEALRKAIDLAEDDADFIDAARALLGE